MTKPNWQNGYTPSLREEELVREELQTFGQLTTERNVTASMWEEIAELILPTSRNTFMYGAWNTPGQKKTDRQIDATGAAALAKFAAILDSLLTPRNQTWHGLAASDTNLMKDRSVKLWFEAANRALFKHRYKPLANFGSQNYQHFLSLGAFGTGGLFIDAFDTRAPGQTYTPGFRYKEIPLGELYIEESHQGIIEGFKRHFRYTAAQAWGKWPDPLRFPEQLRGPLEQGSQQLYDFIHCVAPRQDYDPQRLDHIGKPWHSYYLSMCGLRLLSEGGYNSFPLAGSRYEQTPGEKYGRGPASLVLPSLKTLNAQKRTFLKQAHRAADPVLLTADDGVVDMSMRPGALNKGGVSTDGTLLVHVLPSGEIQVSKEMMAEEAMIIKDAFLVNLFQIITETPQMTATEVIERTTEKGILLAPTVGRQESEYVGPMVHRELDLAMQLRLIPPMPSALLEARGQYDLVNTSPLSRAARAQEAAGFWRTVDQVKEVANITQDPSVFDAFDFDTAIPATAEINGVLPSWMADDRTIAAKRQKRAQAQAKQQQIQAAPAAAGLIKARADAGLPQAGQQPGAPQ